MDTFLEVGSWFFLFVPVYYVVRILAARYVRPRTSVMPPFICLIIWVALFPIWYLLAISSLHSATRGETVSLLAIASALAPFAWLTWQDLRRRANQPGTAKGS